MAWERAGVSREGRREAFVEREVVDWRGEAMVDIAGYDSRGVL